MVEYANKSNFSDVNVENCFWSKSLICIWIILLLALKGNNITKFLGQYLYTSAIVITVQKKGLFCLSLPEIPPHIKSQLFFCFESVAFFLHYFFLPLVSPTFSLCSLVFLWILDFFCMIGSEVIRLHDTNKF